MPWTFKTIKKIKSGKSILIEGLPGMGNVGKIAIDFIIDDLKAEKIYDIVSPKLPHCVFINEENIVELPSISMYHKKLKNKSIFLISGDTQPLDETSCHEFCNEVLSFCKKNSCEEIITLGGVGLQKEPPKPKIYLSSNTKNMLTKYNTSKKLNSIVGPIVGVSGLLVGLADNAKIPAVNIMAETFGHPNYMGVRGAKEILYVLEKKLNLGLNLKRLNKEANELQDISDMDSIEDAEYVDDSQEEHDNNYFG